MFRIWHSVALGTLVGIIQRDINDENLAILVMIYLFPENFNNRKGKENALKNQNVIDNYLSMKLASVPGLLEIIVQTLNAQLSLSRAYNDLERLEGILKNQFFKKYSHQYSPISGIRYAKLIKEFKDKYN